MEIFTRAKFGRISSMVWEFSQNKDKFVYCGQFKAGAFHGIGRY